MFALFRSQWVRGVCAGPGLAVSDVTMARHASIQSLAKRLIAMTFLPTRQSRNQRGHQSRTPNAPRFTNTDVISLRVHPEKTGPQKRSALHAWRIDAGARRNLTRA